MKVRPSRRRGRRLAIEGYAAPVCYRQHQTSARREPAPTSLTPTGLDGISGENSAFEKMPVAGKIEDQDPPFPLPDGVREHVSRVRTAMRADDGHTENWRQKNSLSGRPRCTKGSTSTSNPLREVQFVVLENNDPRRA